MAYHFSKAPEPPKNPICPANIGGMVGTHEPLELVGSDFSRVGFRIHCDDGGLLVIWPCRLCGLMYYRSLGMAEHIEYLIEQAGKTTHDRLDPNQ